MASSDQLDVALAAASQALKTEGEEGTRRGLWAVYLTLVIEHLTAQGVAAEHVAPLVELRQAKLGGADAASEERRDGRSASEELLARVCAVIDLLVKSGCGEEEAAQKLTRQLLAVGLLPPSEGGDARGWKRMLLWHTRLHRGAASASAKASYAHCQEELEAIPAHERVERALRQRVWDRRRNQPAVRRAS